MSLLFAGGLLWLFLAAIPALADGGPHVASVNSGSSALTADSCAGCHRAHTAQGEFLLKAESEQALCLSCHGSGGTGATVDVEFGVQYVPAGDGSRNGSRTVQNIASVAGGLITTSAAHNLVAGQTVFITGLSVRNDYYQVDTLGLTATTFRLMGHLPDDSTPAPGTATVAGPSTGVILGAVRDGGFLKARIDSLHPSRLTYQRGWEDGPYNTIDALSVRTKVGVLSSSASVNSAHIDLTPSALDGIADNHTAWGNGDTGLGAVYTVSCVDCHNPHGNGQYRILKPVPGLEAGGLGEEIPLDIYGSFPQFDTIATVGQHRFAVGDVVFISGADDGALNGTKVVSAVVNGFTFKVSNVTSWTPGALLTTQDLLVAGAAGGTVVEVTRVVTDSNPDPDNTGNPLLYPTKNYTVIAVKGYQGNASTFLLYARDVLAARAAGYVNFVANIASSTASNDRITTTLAHGFGVGDSVTIAGNTTVAGGTYTVATVPTSTTFTLSGVDVLSNGTGGTATKRIPGSFGDTAGDYFHRTVPWNPGLLGDGAGGASVCNPLTSPGSETAASTANGSACTTMQDAPNGQPATINASSSPLSINGQIAFNDQISTWCAACHTRYYSNTNENDGTEQPSSVIDDRGIGETATDGKIYPVFWTNGVQFGGPGYGDRVTFAGAGVPAALTAGEWYVVETGSSQSPNRSWFKVAQNMWEPAYSTGFAAGGSAGSTTSIAAFDRVYQSSASSWWFPRDDGTFKFQHQTTTNRACVTCHVAHGSNAAMTGTQSLAVPYPDGTTTSTSSRLLKIDNRGTCQACHDPTGTIPKGVGLPNSANPPTIPGYIGNNQIP
jgi:predicted CXXCH cytochrome family protein